MSSSLVTQTLDGKQLRANVIRQPSSDEFRFGSYVVPSHTAPSSGGTRTVPATTCKSHIPGYQFKTKMGVINLQQSHVSSKHDENEGVRQPYQEQPAPISPRHAAGDLQPSSQIAQMNQPKAIPRSLLSPRHPDRQSSFIVEPLIMGDRLSSPAVVDKPTNTSAVKSTGSRLAKIETSTPTIQSRESTASDSIPSKVHPYKRRGHAVGIGLRSSDDKVKLAPRFPRGISRIPHQVGSSEMNTNTYSSQHESNDPGVGDKNSNKYLTFSKDQATSHVKSLKEELSSQMREAEEKCETSPVKPRPLERQIKPIATNDINVNDGDSSFSTANNFRQQPICEAFIMTGQSMMKLSCNESENNNCTSTVSNRKQVEPRAKSLSLNKLDGRGAAAGRKPESNYLSKQEIVQIGTTHQANLSPMLNADALSQDQCRLSSREDVCDTSDEAHEKRVLSIGSTLCTTPELGDKLSASFAAGGENLCGKNDDSVRQTATTPPTTTMAKAEPDVRTERIELGVHGICDERPDANGRRHDLKPTSTRAPRSETGQNLGVEGGKGSGIGIESAKPSSAYKLVVADSLPPEAGDPSTYQGSNSQGGADNDTSSGRQPTGQAHSNEQPKDREAPSAIICNDRDSARRLAKRLYNLSGFKKSDVYHHLAKSNPFSQMVAKEYLDLFDFRSMKLDLALRKFLSKLQLNGETQERERMLSQFSQRYYDCNSDKFPSSDIVQTLVCALILLNTDLHGGYHRKKSNKLSLGAFIDGLNNSIATDPRIYDSNVHGTSGSGLDKLDVPVYTFPRHLLIHLYESIKKRPLKCGDEKCDMTSFERELDKIYSQHSSGTRSNTLPTRRFAPGSNAPSSTLSASSRRQLKQGLDKLNSNDNSESAIEFKVGYLNRKRVFETHGRPTSKGRRGWYRFYVILQDLRMIMRPNTNEDPAQQTTAKQQAKTRAQTMAQDMKNTVKIHHTFAKRSSSYTKREFVFHLRFADQSEFLLQADNEQDMNSWIDTINFASACLSSPALPSAVSSNKPRTSRSQRPLLPASYTKLCYWEQLIDHEERLQRLKLELEEHLSEAPNTKNANKRFKTEFIEKIAYLKHEIERYNIYVDLMRKKSNSPEAIILSKHPQIASLNPRGEDRLTISASNTKLRT